MMEHGRAWPRNLSQFRSERCCRIVSAAEDAVAVLKAAENNADPEAVFRAHYKRVARIIAGVVRDHARAEELAVEVFLKLWRHPPAAGDRAPAWLHRAAVRAGLNEIRIRRAKPGTSVSLDSGARCPRPKRSWPRRKRKNACVAFWPRSRSAPPLCSCCAAKA